MVRSSRPRSRIRDEETFARLVAELLAGAAPDAASEQRPPPTLLAKKKGETSAGL